jgi:hypothetical protein
VRARGQVRARGGSGSGSGPGPQSASDSRSGMTGGARPSATAAEQPRGGLSWVGSTRLGCAGLGRRRWHADAGEELRGCRRTSRCWAAAKTGLGGWLAFFFLLFLLLILS